MAKSDESNEGKRTQGSKVSVPNEITRNLSRAELLEIVRDVLPELLTDANVEQILVQHAEFHSGPLPAPQTLQQYNEVLPNFASEIVEEWKKESTHRRQIQNKIADENSERATRASTMRLHSLFRHCWRVSGSRISVPLLQRGLWRAPLFSE